MSRDNPATDQGAIRYLSGEVVRAGDVLADGSWQSSRVVVVIPMMESVAGYDAKEWAYLRSGILVEHLNASGTHLIHYDRLDEDIELLRRAES